MQVRPHPPFTLDQPRQCQHDRDAGDENEQRKDEIVKAEAFPCHMTHLSTEEATDRAQRWALVAQHPVERPDRSVGTDDPEYIEPTQCIDRHDAASLQGERYVCVAHWTP